LIRAGSLADPPEFCIQFIHRDSSEKTFHRRDCRPLVPVYVEDISIEPQDRVRLGMKSLRKLVTR
jgi:hypothetical protein